MDGANLRAGDELIHRKSTQRHNNTRINGFNLRFKMNIAGCQLIGQWIAIAGRAAFDNITDEHLRASDAGLRQQLIQKLACCAHKRTSLLIFMKARSLANEHDLRGGRAFPRHGSLAFRMQGAIGTHRYILCNLSKRLFGSHLSSMQMITYPNDPTTSRSHLHHCLYNILRGGHLPQNQNRDTCSKQSDYSHALPKMP